MVDYHGRFVWYELITTDVAAAKAFYAKVMGWEAQDASTPDIAYTLFSASGTAVSGLMELPQDAQKMGATPRWMVYVGVADADAAAQRIKGLGGAVYVPPTNSNIGRVSVVADPQKASFGLVEGLKFERSQPAGTQLGHVGWSELRAENWQQVFAFYGELFGWQKAGADAGRAESHQLFGAGGQTIGGMFNKHAIAIERIPFWLNYVNIENLDAAVDQVKSAGGEISEGPLELPDGGWIVRCRDPQGAAFAMQGKSDLVDAEVGWSTEWGGISSRGRLRTARPRSQD
jgi:predicted enzyme related to lactoylglutathione lyase